MQARKLEELSNAYSTELPLYFIVVGAEKGSLYRLGFLGFDAYLIIMKRGRFDKGACQPFCWIVGQQPRPIE